LERYIRCKSGNLLCGECKSDLANNTKTFIIEFKRKREKAKDKVKDFMFDEKCPA
jgi:tryptophanyl-tRNA synthetase